MGALLILVLGGLLAVGLWTWLAEHHAPARRVARWTGDPLGRRSAREIVERRTELEAEDLAQMLEVHNAHRRRRGKPERTIEDVELLVHFGTRRPPETRRPAAPDSAAEQDLAELLEATNARRRARGLPERTREDVGVRVTPEP